MDPQAIFKAFPRDNQVAHRTICHQGTWIETYDSASREVTQNTTTFAMRDSTKIDLSQLVTDLVSQ